MTINTCFVVMGYKVKRSEDGKEYDLDKSYEKIIKPVLDENKIEYLRADELLITEMIDDSMYKLLLSVDLVIADITTLSPNALYELGVRFALKPSSTIIIADISTQLPFDINHLRIFKYKHGGNDIDDHESRRMIADLNTIIGNLRNKPSHIDSPVYTYIEGLNPPQIELGNRYFVDVKRRYVSSDSLCTLVNSAYAIRNRGQFEEAIKIYKKALKIFKDEYIIKEIATCMYQKGDKNSLIEARQFLTDNIDIESTLSPEILKTLGTINKKLYLLTKNEQYAIQAFKFYEKSFITYNAYNSGLNYGFMAFLLSRLDNRSRKNYYYLGRIIYERVKEICIKIYDAEDYWVNASLEECYFALNDKKNYQKYSVLASNLIKQNCEQWKRNKTLEQLKILKKIR